MQETSDFLHRHQLRLTFQIFAKSFENLASKIEVFQFSREIEDFF